MLTDEELPPAPRLKLSRMFLGGLMAWSLFFGAIGGLAILMMADAFFDIPHEDHRRELKDPNKVEEQVASVHERVTLLERQTQQLKALQRDVARQVGETNAQVGTQISQQLEQQLQRIEGQDDTRLAKIVVGLTQLKTAYDGETSLQDGINTLKQAVDDVQLQQLLDDLGRLTENGFPSRENILQDLQAYKEAKRKENDDPRRNPELGWRDRARQAAGQLVRVTPAEDVTRKNTVSRVEQAVLSGNFALADRYAADLPQSPSSQIVTAKIRLRLQAQALVQRIANQISATIIHTNKNLY